MLMTPELPPLFRLARIAEDADPRAHARALAEQGADPATVVWSPRADRLLCAVVLAPDQAYETAILVTFVAVVALGDALGALVPAGVDVAFEWPNRVQANAGLVAEVHADAPAISDPAVIPDWLVVSAEVTVTPSREGDYDDSDLSTTSLYEEGCFEVTPALVLEHFARYFLNWVNRWQDDGFAPVRTSWINRTPERGEKIGVEVDGTWVAGKLVELRDDGALVMQADGDTRVFELARAF